jgi:hypothetical protein
MSNYNIDNITCNTTQKIIIVVSFFIIVYVLQNNKEEFTDEYYNLDWTNSNLTDYVNNDIAYNSYVCNKYSNSNCTYSMSCDFTDDALPHCFSSLDVPTRINGKYMNNSI